MTARTGVDEVRQVISNFNLWLKPEVAWHLSTCPALLLKNYQIYLSLKIIKS